jgi:hypothetical protein
MTCVGEVGKLVLPKTSCYKVDVLTKILTQHLLNINHKQYCFSQLPWSQ